MQQAAPAVGQAYTNAANADAGYARGLGTGVQSQLDSSQSANNDFLAKMGTPSGALHQAPAVGDISYGLQGYIPATSLQREGAGWESAAQLAPGNLLNAGQEQAQSILQNDPQAVTLQNELAKIAATAPDVYQKILTGYQNQAYKNAELGLSRGRLSLDQQKAVFDQWAKQQGLKQGWARVSQGQQRIGISQQNANISAARLAQSTLNQNRNYRLALQRLGISKRSLQLRAAKLDAKASGSGTGGFTPNEIKTIKNTAANMAQNLFNGVPATTKNPARPPASYKFAMKYMITHGIPPSIADSELRAYGYRVGDGRGTPPEALHFPGGGGPLAGGPAANTIVNMAHEYIGTPYVWGGESPKGFDCSGFAQYLYAKAGIHIPRTTYTQWQAGHAVGKQQLAPGDLVFFRGSDSKGGLPGHVGIYIGDGMMIDAPHTGADVRVESVFNFPGYMGARRYGRG